MKIHALTSLLCLFPGIFLQAFLAASRLELLTHSIKLWSGQRAFPPGPSGDEQPLSPFEWECCQTPVRKIHSQSIEEGKKKAHCFMVFLDTLPNLSVD